MPLLLTNDDLATLDLPVADLVDPVEAAFRELGRGEARSPGRTRMFLPAPQLAATYWFNNLMGASPTGGFAALRIDSVFSRLVERDGGQRKQRVGDFVGLVLLFDLATGELAAIMHDHFLSTRRVAATSAVGVRYLARPESRVLGLVGSGEQAEQHAHAVASVRPIEQILVFSPTPANRQTLATRLASDLSVAASPTATARDAVAAADVVVAATSSRTPVLEGAWLRPGTHLVSIVGGDRHWPAREIGVDAVARADRIVVNRKEQILADEQPKLLDAVAEGALDLTDVDDLADVVAESAAGRGHDDEITLHDNNTGMGLQFAVVGGVTLRRARAAGLGRTLEDDWFTTRGGTYAP